MTNMTARGQASRVVKAGPERGNSVENREKKKKPVVKLGTKSSHAAYFMPMLESFAARDDLNEEKRRFAHEHPFLDSFTAAVEALRPLAIVGVSGQPKQFGREVLERGARTRVAWSSGALVLFR